MDLRLDQARAMLAAAETAHYQVHMIRAAALVYDALPNAAALTLAQPTVADSAIFPEAWLHAIYAADGTVLWRRGESSPQRNWPYTMESITDALLAAADDRPLPDAAVRLPGWSRQPSLSLENLYRIKLPSPSEVDHLMTTSLGEPANPAGLSVWILHRWSDGQYSAEPYATYEGALQSLATEIRASSGRSHRLDEFPASVANLTDADVVSLHYCGAAEPAPTCGAVDHSGFLLLEMPVRGPEPTQLNLRMATLRVLDEVLDGSHESSLTYYLDAVGLTLSVHAGVSGPVVRLRNDNLPADLPVTVISNDDTETPNVLLLLTQDR
ncbi:hypothetical protein [Saccharopolyspora elongata]|uniref:Uncharacterized protein n=1 Tax=Saccharopolyspora elongata TaxID=2530387 RepID=A0A4V2YIM6_9PSEU|nr:hypothetical protein [Saccharopolyspora elongata]TDD35487.1 hypothetical protein E1288_43075 [Saccharopolyspora elongata]